MAHDLCRAYEDGSISDLTERGRYVSDSTGRRSAVTGAAQMQFNGSPAATASDVAASVGAPRESAPTRGVREGIRLLVLLRWLLAVFGIGRLLRKAALGLRVRLAGLRSLLLVGLVGPVKRGFAHGDLLPRRRGSHASSLGAAEGAPGGSLG